MNGSQGFPTGAPNIQTIELPAIAGPVPAGLMRDSQACIQRDRMY